MEENNKIPKVIHYSWFGKNELGKSELDCIKSWKEVMPDYEIIRWDETNYDINKNFFIKEAYKNKKWAFVADYARLDIIYNYGGIYLDTDVEVIKRFDDLLDNECFFGFENDNCVAFGLGFGAKKNNPFIKINLDAYNDIKFDIDKLNKISSPQITTKIAKEYGLKLNNSYQKNEILTLYPKDYFCPKDYYSNNINITKNTYSIHHYSMSWLSERDKKWYNVSVIMCKIFGKKIGKALTLTFKTPGSIIISIKEKGLKATIKRYLKK